MNHSTMRITVGSRTAFLARIAPYVCIATVGVFFALETVLGDTQLAVKGLLAFGIPVVLASVIALRWARSHDTGGAGIPQQPRFTCCSFTHLVLGFVLMYLVSLCLLFTGTERPLAYFWLVAAMAGVLFLEILGVTERDSQRQAIVLGQVVMLFLNTVFSVTLKFPLYYGGTDLPQHITWMNTILTSGHVTSEMSYYQHFPLFHILNAAGVLVTGAEATTSYFLVNGLAFAVLVPVVYVLVRRVAGDIRVGLGAALCYSMAGCIINYGMYMVTRCMAFVLLLLVLYLLIRQKADLRLRILAVLVIPALVLTHQTSLAQFSVLLAILIGTELILYHRSHLSYGYLALFTCAYLAYWIYLSHAFFLSIAKTASGYGETAALAALPADSSPVPVILSVAQNSDYTILLFLSTLGILAQLCESRVKVSMGYSFALFSLIAIPLFVPALYGMFNPTFMFYRTPILFMAFFAFVMAKGLLLLAEQLAVTSGRLARLAMRGVSFVLVMLFAFASLTISSNSVDRDFGRILGTQNRDYYTRAELESFHFVSSHQGKAPIHCDYPTRGYLLLDPNVSIARTTTQGFNGELCEEAYFLFRKEEYYSRGQLEFIIRSDGGSEAMILYTPGDTPDIETMWGNKQRIFDSQSVEICLRR